MTAAPEAVAKASLPHRIARVWADEYDTLTSWPAGRRHLITRAIIITVVDTLALMLVAALLPGISLDGNLLEIFLAALIVTVIAGLITFAVRPVFFLVFPQWNVVVTGVLTILFMGLTLLVASWFVPHVQISGFIPAFVASILIGGINAVLVGIIGLDEDESFYRNSLRHFARSRGDTDDRPGPGFIILQVDGLSEPVIRHALRTGYMPLLASWLRDGTHKLGRWEAYAPSMTSAGQTGILHGNTDGIPAFRWWEKERNYLMVSNHPDDAFEIERRASGPNDLLRDGGTSISNLVSGGATRSVATNSQLSKSGQGLQMDSFSLYLVNPYNITRGAVQFASSIVGEYFQARRQRTRDIQPRIGRGMPFPVLKAATTTLMRDMTTDLIIGEMYRGTPIVYADYLGYDEIAHHAGPERPEAMDQLDRVDRMVRSLARAARDAPRRYHFILVSDHGQTQGAPFEDRYGIGLEDLVRELMTGAVTSLDATNDVEGWGHVNTFLTEAARTPGTTGNLVRRAMRGQTKDGVVAFGGGDDPHKGATVEGAAGAAEREGVEEGAEIPDLIVAASGNLANIYFTEVRERMTLEDIATRHPRLLPGLVSHEGIGFVMVRSEVHGPIAIGRRGVRFLKDDSVEGEDPIAVFGPHTADNLRRLDGFQHVGDIFVISMYDPSTEEIAPFEHQVGAHGGLGGNQTKAFVLYPSILERQVEPVSLVGAPAVNAKLHEWIARARELDAAGATEAAEPQAEAPLPAVLQGAGTASQPAAGER
jgi:uncharacterized membrane protein YvlD (DUF360 family)